MEKILIEPEDKFKLDLVKSMLEAMRIGFKVVVAENDNPSPSRDPYFDNPKNVKEILRRKKEMEMGAVEPETLTEDALNELLNNA
ncbi:hypothetical protein [Algoriphagus aquimarinus]|uniref:hypothetical protein n=1 Tax=Algoriphagus aquimarinus TaxID=237018 RepID=UPI0030DC50C4|tara:strand:- start:65547 stop:65801 length:255 start_codon:yes stop_codon:yes gene_type:complete